MSNYNISYVTSGQVGPNPPAGAAPPDGVPPYPPAPQPGYAPGMVPPGQAPPMVAPGHAPPMVVPPAMNMAPVHNPPVPLITQVPHPMQDGQTIHITGAIPANPDRFLINLSLGSGLNEKVGTAIHINPRWGDSQVVRNSFLGGWGQEERWGDVFPLQAGQNFECVILVQSDCYKVAFNGHHFCEYKHRHSKDEVTHLVIEGDVTLSCVWFQGPTPNMGGVMPGVTMPPAVTFNVPYQQEIPGALNAGRLIYISGVPKAPSYDRFVINFGCDEKFEKDIALHFNPRYGDKVVVRNTKAGLTWGNEERSEPEFPFHPGKPFDVTVLVEQDQYKVAVNGQHFISYQHRLRNLEQIKFLQIKGDVTLTNVRV